MSAAVDSDRSAAPKAPTAKRDDPYRLKSMPPEIRNRIYESTFCPDPDRKIELSQTALHHKALLLTCRQMHDEAKGIYNATCRHFWSSSKFWVTAEINQSFASRDEKPFSLIENLTIHGQNGSSRYDHGLWYVQKDGNTPYWLAILPAFDASGARSRPVRWSYTVWYGETAFHVAECSKDNEAELRQEIASLRIPPLTLPELQYVVHMLSRDAGSLPTLIGSSGEADEAETGAAESCA